jgi:hypothetical protein
MVADRGGGDGTSMRPRVPELLVNIAHSLKLNKSSGFASDWAAVLLLPIAGPRGIAKAAVRWSL